MIFLTILASTAGRASQYFILIEPTVGLLGLSQACLWYIATKTTIKYLNLWRDQMIKIDKVVDRRQHHAEVLEVATTTLSPDQLITWLCVVFIVGWLVLLGVLLWTILAQL